MEDNSDYLKRVYSTLHDSVDGFTKSESEFMEAMKDSSYASRVHKTLQETVDGFSKTQEEFFAASGLGKPSPGSGGGGSGAMRLPSNLSGEQVKNYFSKMGLQSMTDGEYDEIAKQAAGQSIEEAKRLAISVAQKRIPNQARSLVFDENTRPVSAVAEQLLKFGQDEVAAQAIRDQMGGQQEEIAPAPTPGGFVPTDLENEGAPVMQADAFAPDPAVTQQDDNISYIIANKNAAKRIGLGGFGNVELDPEEESPKEKVRADVEAKIRSNFVGSDAAKRATELASTYITSNAELRRVQEESTAKIKELTASLDAMKSDPNADPVEVQKTKKQLENYILVNNVAAQTYEPLMKKDEEARYAALPWYSKTSTATSNYINKLKRSALPTVVNSIGEIINTIEDAQYASVGLDKPEGANAIGNSFKEMSQIANAYYETEARAIGYQRIASESVFDDLNLMNISSNAGAVSGSMTAVAVGSMVGGPTGAAVTGGALMFGDSVDEARKAGYDDTEARAYGLIISVGSGILEEVGFSGITSAFKNELLKKSILNAVRTEARAGTPVGKIVNKVLEMTTNTIMAASEGAIPESLTEGSQTTLELGTKYLFNLTGMSDKDGFELPDLTEAIKQIGESMVVAAPSGGAIPAVATLFSKSPNYQQLAIKAIADDGYFRDVMSNANALLVSGRITPEQHDQLEKNLQIAKAAEAAVPKYIRDGDIRTRAMELVMRKTAIEADMKAADPALQSGYKAELEGIKAELKAIADKSWKAPIDPIEVQSLAGVESMVSSLKASKSKDEAAKAFLATIASQRGFLQTLSNTIDANTEIVPAVIEKVAKQMQELATYFLGNEETKDQVTPDARKAAQAAQDFARKVLNHKNTADVHKQNFELEGSGIKLELATPPHLINTYNDVMNGEDVSEGSAKEVSDHLYAQYKAITDYKKKLADKLTDAISSGDKAEVKRISKAIDGVSDTQKSLSDDINAMQAYINDKMAHRHDNGGTAPEPGSAPEEWDGPVKPSDLKNWQYDSSKSAQMSADYRISPVVMKALNGIAKLMEKMFPNVKIYVHHTNENFYNSVEASANAKLGKNQKTGADRAMVVMDSKTGKPKAIHFNMGKITSDMTNPAEKRSAIATFAHEATHVILQEAFGNNEKLFNDFKNKLGELLSGTEAKSLEKFIENYDSNKAEEFLAELAGRMASSSEQITKPLGAKIAAAINDLLTRAARSLGYKGDLKPLLSQLQDKSDLIDFMNTISEAARTGIVAKLPEVMAKAKAKAEGKKESEQTRSSKSDIDIFAGVDAALDLLGSPASEARSAIKSKYGSKAVKAAVRITREFNKIVSDLERDGTVTKECP